MTQASSERADVAVIDDPNRSRFELALPGSPPAFIDYLTRADGVVVLIHAEVPMALRGAGVGARLAGGALELLRERHARIVPHCPYVAQFIRRHPQYQTLLASG